MDFIEPVAARVPYMVQVGNHEYGESTYTHMHATISIATTRLDPVFFAPSLGSGGHVPHACDTTLSVPHIK